MFTDVSGKLITTEGQKQHRLLLKDCVGCSGSLSSQATRADHTVVSDNNYKLKSQTKIKLIDKYVN
jgi:hypothetical protein